MNPQKRSKILLFVILIFVIRTPIVCFAAALFTEGITSSFEPLEQEVDTLDENSLVVLDIDDTIFTYDIPAPNGGFIFEQLGKHEQSERQKNRTMQKLYQLKPLLIEPRIIQLIKRLQEKGIRVIALTSSGHGKMGPDYTMQDFKVHLLHSVGIHFENSFPNTQIINFLNLRQQWFWPIFYQGILFAGRMDKGTVLEEFLKTINLAPSLRFFDDQAKNVASIAQAAQRLNISGKAFEYRGLESIPKDRIYLHNQKLHYLLSRGKWPSDEEARNFNSWY